MNIYFNKPLFLNKIHKHLYMYNHICCILTIHPKDYEYIAPRLQYLGFSLCQTKQLQISLMMPTLKKKQQTVPKKPLRRYQQPIIRLSQRNASTYLFPSPNLKKYDDNFVYEATYLRTQNTFTKMMKDWSYFKDLKQSFTKKIQIQVYNCKQTFEIQFYHSDGQSEQILMIMSDLTSSAFLEKGSHLQNKQFWKTKIYNHFRDLYTLLGGSYNQHNQFQNLSMKSKGWQFEQNSKKFIQKIIKMISKQGYKTLFWMLRIAGIIQFVLLEQENQNRQEKKKKNNTQMIDQAY